MQQDLPPHVRHAVEEAWAVRLTQQADAWKRARAGQRTATETGVLVIRRPVRASAVSQGQSPA